MTAVKAGFGEWSCSSRQDATELLRKAGVDNALSFVASVTDVDRVESESGAWYEVERLAPRSYWVTEVWQ